MHEIQVSRIPQNLPALIADYLQDKPVLRNFHEGVSTVPKLLNRMAQRSLPQAQRAILVDALNRQYTSGTDTVIQQQIDCLLNENTVTVTTGHQLGLATGPLFLIYKILSTAALAKKLNAIQRERKVVPVFWLASEDHDIEEIDHVNINGKKIAWQTGQSGPVGRLATEGIANAIDEILGALIPSPLTNEITGVIRSLDSETNYGKAFRAMICQLTNPLGVVVLDADDKELKRSFSAQMKKELEEQVIETCVKETNQQLTELSYSPQVNPRPINLFLLSDQARHRLTREADGRYIEVNGPREFSSSEITRLLEEHPDQFSPNVLLRPVYQEFILPNIATFGGPGELSYWLQLRSTFRAMDVPFPILMLRNSFLLIHPKSTQRMSKLGLSTTDLFRKRHDLERQLAAAAGPIDLDLEREQLISLYSTIAAKASEVDITLDTAAKAEGQKHLTALDQFEKRILRAAKQKEEQRITQLNKLLDELFPNEGPQERHDNYFDHCARAGRWLIPELLNACDPFDTSVSVLFLQDGKTAAAQATTEE